MEKNFESALASLSEDVKRGDEEKQRIIDELHEINREIPEGKDVTGWSEGEPRFVEWNKRAHRAMVMLPSGKRAPVTVGELITDGEWGIDYTLAGQIPGDIRQRFIAAEARREIQKLTNKQIIESEEYRKIKENEDIFIAKKLVMTFFEKNIIDHSLDMNIEHADLRDSINCIITRLEHSRGIGTTVGKDLMINTTNQKQSDGREELEKMRERCLSHVDNIVLVTLPVDHLRQKYESWMKNEMRPGGPMKMWNVAMKEQIFRGVLQGIFTEDEITRMWESILGDEDNMSAKIGESIGCMMKKQKEE